MKNQIIKTFLVTVLLVITVFQSRSQILIDKEDTIEVLTSEREQICLNGIWDFAPLPVDENVSMNIDFGNIRVPGAWFLDAWWVLAPGVSQKGNAANWEYEMRDISMAWYKRTISIPATWKNKKILFEIEHVSTDAIIYIDNEAIDTINWPGGVADLTTSIKAGKEHELKILVFATTSPEKYFNLMGTATSQVSMVEQSLASKGITGNVYLKAIPDGPVINDVYIQTSYRNKEISAILEIGGIKKPGEARVNVSIFNQKEQKVKEFSGKYMLYVSKENVLELSSEWSHPELWDLDQPNMYKAIVTVSSKEMHDQYAQRFGFREFWVSGKHLYLNGKKINLRPASGYGPKTAMHELIDAQLNSYRETGFNFAEIWPQDPTRRGFISARDEIIRRASEKGFLLTGPLPPAIPFIMSKNWEFTWNEEGMKDAYKKQLLPYMKKYRNEPSIIMWTMNPNFFGHENDQNPVVIGRKNWVKENKPWVDKANAGFDVIDIVKKIDPTRPVINHHNAYVGDMHTVNLYLCFTPLQEREEWLSHYKDYGTLPFMGIEFGTPLECTMLRGRAPFHENIITEPLFSEFSATYLGKRAYQLETEAYRNEIKNRFIGGQTYKKWQNNPISGSLPSFQEIQELFVRNTWRSWRTYEISGGLLAWSNAHGWAVTEKGTKMTHPADDYPGRRGTFFDSIPALYLNFLDTPFWETRPAAIELMKNNSSTLAYIAGKEEAFTSKNHSYLTGSTVNKQVFIFNDTRNSQSFDWTCTAYANNSKLKEFSSSGKVPVASSRKFPVTFILPDTFELLKTECKLILNCRIGDRQHTDTFAFRVFNYTATENEMDLACYDPVGHTKEMLEFSGIRTTPWTGDLKVPVLIIGREVLSEGYKLPGDIKEYVSKGGKLLIMQQKPAWTEEKMGFRLSKHVTRYVFPVNPHHPVCKNLDEKDLRNWNGSGTLVEPYPEYFNRRVKTGMYGLPYYGYHWGNRGSVASAAFEKPHLSGWRPILECEFDLAFSPLMELNYGKGLIMLSMLDLEDNYRTDPAAFILFNNIIEYLNNYKTREKKINVCFSGNEETGKLLELAGLQYFESNIDDDTGLFIFTDTQKINEERLRNYLQKGGTALCLYQSNVEGIFDIKYRHEKSFNGSCKIDDWPELDGISASDMRWRTSHDTWLIENGCEISVDGLIGRKKLGNGMLILCQVNPDIFNADSLTYFRYTRWRQTRALVQLLANLKAVFNNDCKIFRMNDHVEKISLEGNWFAKITDRKPATISLISEIEDTGLSDEAHEIVQPGFDILNLQKVNVPEEMEKYDMNWYDANGEAVFLFDVYLPPSFIGKDLIADLGVIDDYDITFFNGEIIGKTEKEFEDFWGYERKYIIPGTLVKPGINRIAIRIFDIYGKGGLLGSEREMTISIASDKKELNYYHPDYRDDFKYGDDPFRFFRW